MLVNGGVFLGGEEVTPSPQQSGNAHHLQVPQLDKPSSLAKRELAHSPAAPQRHGQDGLSSPWHWVGAPGHPQSLSGNISLLFQPPEHVALAQAENPRCPVLGAASRGSGQLCPRCGAASPGEQTFPHSTSTSLDRCASSTPALLLTPHLPRAGTNHISTSSADLSNPPPVQSHPLPAVTALWWHTRLWSHFSRR